MVNCLVRLGLAMGIHGKKVVKHFSEYHANTKLAPQLLASKPPLLFVVFAQVCLIRLDQMQGFHTAFASCHVHPTAMSASKSTGLCSYQCFWLQMLWPSFALVVTLLGHKGLETLAYQALSRLIYHMRGRVHNRSQSTLDLASHLSIISILPLQPLSMRLSYTLIWQGGR